MAQGSSGGALIAASLILGGALLGGSYLVAGSIDRGAAVIGDLKDALQVAVAQPPSRPPTQAPSRRPDPSRVYDVKIGSAPVKGSAQAAINVVEFVDFQ